MKNLIGPARQWRTCLLMCAAALAIAMLSGRSPEELFASELTIATQVLVGLGLGLAACLSSFIGYRLTADRPMTQHTIQSYSRLNLAGLNPLWIALAAGVGEELLFRGALQPVVGIWLSSFIFVLAHTRAYRFTSLNQKTLVQAAGLFAASAALGVVARYAGLLAAMILHTAIDVAGLYTIRYASASQLRPIPAVDGN